MIRAQNPYVPPPTRVIVEISEILEDAQNILQTKFLLLIMMAPVQPL
jgi:hypothetical protein